MIIKVKHGEAYCEKIPGWGWYINNINVEEGYRRQGIGTALMEKILFKISGPIFLYASPEYGIDENTLVKFYQRFGFEKISREDKRNLTGFPYKVNMIKQ